jgi:hypothetical protein
MKKVKKAHKATKTSIKSKEVKPLTETELNDIMNASTGIYDEDEERVERDLDN